MAQPDNLRNMGWMMIVMGLLSMFGNIAVICSQILQFVRGQETSLRSQAEWIGYAAATYSLLAIACLGVLFGPFIIWAGLQVKNLTRYRHALAGSVLLMIPVLSCCCVFNTPFGLWCFTTLRRDDVRNQFS